MKYLARPVFDLPMLISTMEQLREWNIEPYLCYRSSIIRRLLQALTTVAIFSIPFST